MTQYQFTGAAQASSEAHLLPVLEGILHMFPFKILGFHSDNGSEYINHRVAQMLEKLQAEFTKSRARHSNDNGLFETKNASVIRKIVGNGHIERRWAAALDEFHREVLGAYLNYHRPCLFASECENGKVQLRKRYRDADVMTPYERLRGLPEAQSFLRAGVSFEHLDREASRQTDLELEV